jgi:hypothetical protein
VDYLPSLQKLVPVVRDPLQTFESTGLDWQVFPAADIGCPDCGLPDLFRREYAHRFRNAKRDAARSGQMKSLRGYEIHR